MTESTIDGAMPAAVADGGPRTDLKEALRCSRSCGVFNAVAGILLGAAATAVFMGFATRNDNPMLWILVALLGIACHSAGRAAEGYRKAAEAYGERAVSSR